MAQVLCIDAGGRLTGGSASWWNVQLVSVCFLSWPAAVRRTPVVANLPSA